MNRYKIALGERSKRVKKKKTPQRHLFFDAGSMFDYMFRTKCCWIPIKSDPPIIAYQNGHNEESVEISVDNYNGTKHKIVKSNKPYIDSSREIIHS